MLPRRERKVRGRKGTGAVPYIEFGCTKMWSSPKIFWRNPKPVPYSDVKTYLEEESGGKREAEQRTGHVCVLTQGIKRVPSREDAGRGGLRWSHPCGV